MNTLIQNAVIIPMTSDTHFHLTGDVGITDKIISHVGKTPEEFIPDTIIDGRGFIVMPGLVNTHNHLSMTLLRSYADDMDLFSWLQDKIWPVEAKLSTEDIYWGSMLGAAEQIRGGITSFADMYFHQEQTIKAITQAGIRGNICATFMGDKKASEERLDVTYKLHQDFNGSADGRISIDMAPHAIYTCTADTLKITADLAQELGCRIHTHISESVKEQKDCMEAHGMTPLAYLESLGCLEVPLYAAHGVYLTDEDITMAKRNNVHVVHNPTSNLKLGNGFAPVEKFIAAGLAPALGTDGASSNNNLNMFEEMHIASLIHKGLHGDPMMLKAHEILQMATINGAKALGLDTITGSLAPGKEADLMMIDTMKPHLQPLNDPISAVVYGAQASDVDTLFCQGKMVMQKRALLTLDEEDILKNAARVSERLTKNQ